MKKKLSDQLDETWQCSDSRKSKPIRKKSRVLWTQKESLAYAKFIGNYKTMLLARSKKQKQKVFNRMAAAILTRDPACCKSHHHNMMNKHGSIEQIRKHIEGERYIEEKETIKETNTQEIVKVEDEMEQVIVIKKEQLEDYYLKELAKAMVITNENRLNVNGIVCYEDDEENRQQRKKKYRKIGKII